MKMWGTARPKKAAKVILKESINCPLFSSYTVTVQTQQLYSYRHSKTCPPYWPTGQQKHWIFHNLMRSQREAFPVLIQLPSGSTEQTWLCSSQFRHRRLGHNPDIQTPARGSLIWMRFSKPACLPLDRRNDSGMAQKYSQTIAGRKKWQISILCRAQFTIDNSRIAQNTQSALQCVCVCVCVYAHTAQHWLGWTIPMHWLSR